MASHLDTFVVKNTMYLLVKKWSLPYHSSYGMRMPDGFSSGHILTYFCLKNNFVHWIMSVVLQKDIQNDGWDVSQIIFGKITLN